MLRVPGSGPCRRCGWGTQALEPRLSSCGAQAQVPCGTQNLPEPGIEPVSLRRQGLLVPGPLGQSLSFLTTHSTAGGTAALSPELLLSPKSQEDGAEQSRSALHTRWVCCMAEETHAQEPWSSGKLPILCHGGSHGLYCAGRKPSLRFRGRHDLYLLRLLLIQTSMKRKKGTKADARDT